MKKAFPYKTRDELDFQWEVKNEIKKEERWKIGSSIVFSRTRTKVEYKTTKPLGEGGFGIVYLGKWKKNDERLGVKQDDKLAVKKIPYESATAGALRNEIKICKALVHTNIVKTFEGFRLEKRGYKFVYIAMEYCAGGELFDVIVEQDKQNTYLPLVCVKKIIQQTINALVYAHEQGYVHRDLKPENILLVKPYEGGDNFPDIKVADWGLATTKTTLSDCSKKSKCDISGTPGYIAPEENLKKYNEEVDLWAVGVILSILLTNKDVLPSEEDGSYKNIEVKVPKAIEEVKTVLNNRRPKKKVSEEKWTEKVSAWVKFFTNLLKINPVSRWSAAAAAAHSATAAMYHQYVAVKF